MSLFLVKMTYPKTSDLNTSDFIFIFNVKIFQPADVCGIILSWVVADKWMTFVSSKDLSTFLASEIYQNLLYFFVIHGEAGFFTADSVCITCDKCLIFSRMENK